MRQEAVVEEGGGGGGGGGGGWWWRRVVAAGGWWRRRWWRAHAEGWRLSGASGFFSRVWTELEVKRFDLRRGEQWGVVG